MIEIAEIGLEIHEIMNGKSQHIEKLVDLYLKLFPRYERYVQVMRQRANSPVDAIPPFIEHQWLAFINGDPVALMVFKYNRVRNCGIGLDLGIHPKYKSIKFGNYDRLAKLLIDLRSEQVIKDAASYGNLPPLGIVVEVESPKVVNQFSKYGMVQLPVRYYEPPAPERLVGLMEPRVLEITGFKPMKLGVYPLKEGDPDFLSDQSLVNFVKAILLDHYGLSESHWAVREALDSILSKENLK